MSPSFPLLFFCTVLMKLLTTDRKGHIVFTRPLHFCYIILGTGDFKGIYQNKDTIVLAVVSTQLVFPKFRDYLGNRSNDCHRLLTGKNGHRRVTCTGQKRLWETFKWSIHLLGSSPMQLTFSQNGKKQRNGKKCEMLRAFSDTQGYNQ